MFDPHHEETRGAISVVRHEQLIPAGLHDGLGSPAKADEGNDAGRVLDFEWFDDNQGVVFGEQRGAVRNRDCGDFRGMENDAGRRNEAEGERRGGRRRKRVEVEGKGEGARGNVLDLEGSVARSVQIHAAERQNGRRRV